MHPRSCANCCFNGLQSQDVGLAVGYCVEHRLVLHEPGATTCARLFRRDLALVELRRDREAHRATVPDQISFLRTPTRDVIAERSADRDATLLESDRVGAVLVDYRRLDSTSTSLNRLNEIDTTRAEVARLGLTRTYVNWCNENPKGDQPPWLSGFRFLWWTRQSLKRVPEIAPADLRNGARLPLGEQEDLAKWSILMERLTFLSDMGHHAHKTNPTDPVASLRELSEDAAASMMAPSFGSLMRWVERVGSKRVERAFPRDRYERLRGQYVPVEDGFLVGGPARAPKPQAGRRARPGARRR